MTIAKFHRQFLGSAFALILLPSFGVSADDDLDVTMRMVTSDDTLTDSVVREIQLSEPIGLEGKPGVANETAEEARERGREFGQSVAEQAREAARLRKEAKPEKPGEPESAPGRPDNPGNT